MNLELLDSKNWKDRSSFYTSLTWHTSDISILKKLSQETTVPALESCLNAIISYPNSDYENSKQILKNINNIKLKPLFIKYFIKHFDSNVIDDIINSIQTIKLAKTVVIYCEILQRLVEHYNISFDLKVLEYVLKHGDPNVRKEGISLCVCVYRIEGDNIFRYLQNVKEMQIKEIKERIEGNSKESSVKNERTVAKNIETVVENTRTEDTIVEAVAMKEEYKPLETNKVTKKEQVKRPVEKTLPVDQNIKPFLRNYRNIERYNEPTDLLITQLKSTNYKDRIEALTTIQDTPVSLNSEIEGIIITKVNDVNLQVTTLAIESCVLLRNNKEVVKALCERLKDKRLKTVIFYVMKELKTQNMDIFEAIDFVKCKNPIMKVSLLEYMKYERFETYQLEGIVLMTSDGNKDVREGAFECCKAIYNTKHRNLLPAKIQEKLSIELGNENCETSKVENVIVEEKIQKSVLIEDGNLEYFFAKYPVLKNISSTKRYEDIAKSDITKDKYFIKFCILYTDSFYRVNEYLIDECMRKEIHSENYHELIFAFLSKLGDSKLKMKIKELIIYLYNKESNETIKAIRNFLETKRAGTLFCAAMTIYGEIGALQDILYLESLDQTGKNEKDAIYAAIKNIKDRNAQLSIATENSSVCKKQVNVNKRKHFVTKSAIIKQKISNRPKDCKNKEILFTDEFTSMLASKNDYKKVLMLFEQEDMLSLSDYIIEYFDKHDLLTVDYDYAKKYINNLISYFIDKEYILKEIEARMLCGILKNEKEMVLKLPLIYPKSKLEKLMIKQNDFDSMNASFLSMKVENSFINSPCKKSKRDVKFDNISNLRPFACVMKINDNDRVPEIKSQNEYVNTNNDSINEYNKSMPMDTQNSSFILDKATLEKYSFEMSQYKTVSTNVDRLALERILADLIDSKCQRSEKAFKDLNTIIDSNVASLYFSRNAIVSSIIMQLSESILTKNKFSSYILSTLLKLCKDVGFVSDLSTNAIQTINIDMINIISDEKNNETPNTTNINLASDILLAICSNGDHVVVFKTYLSLFDTITGDARKLLYKLICKHAKHTKSICDEKPKVQEIIDALNVFLEKNCLKIIKNDVVAIKVIQLHINEYCLYFRDRIYEFRLEGLVGRIVDKTMGKVKVEIEDVKRRIDELQKQ